MEGIIEYIEVEEIDAIQREIRSLNYKLLDALNQTNMVKELISEKNKLINHAADTSQMMIPEVRALNSFICGESFDENTRPTTQPEIPHMINKRRPGRPRKIITSVPRIPKELNAVLPKSMQQKPTKKRGRPKKTIAKQAKTEKPVLEQSHRDNPLEELRRNLARLRQ
jgi:hypothetical protein